MRAGVRVGHRTSLAAAAAWLLGASLAAFAPPVPAAEAPAQPLEAITVTGERPGPGLWKVTAGDHAMWILGTLDPLPKRMIWRSAQVDALLDRAELVLLAPRRVHLAAGPFGLLRLYFDWRRVERNPDDRRLESRLPPDLYARFARLRDRYDPHDSKIDRLRPMVAAQRLYRAAIDAVGLTSARDVEETVVKDAKRHHVPVREDSLTIEDPRGLVSQLDAVAFPAEVRCLEVTVNRLETDLSAMRERASAWAVGDVERLHALPYPDQKMACWEAVETAARFREFAARVRTQWLDAAEAALREHRVTLAVVPIDLLLAKDGVLPSLRERGYRIEEP